VLKPFDNEWIMDHIFKRNYTETNGKYMLFVEILDVVFRKIDVYRFM